MKYRETRRQNEKNEYITTAHILSFFVILAAMVLSNKLVRIDNISALYQLPGLLLLYLLACLVFIGVIIYNTKHTWPTPTGIVPALDLSYVGFSLVTATVALATIGHNNICTGVILLLPVLITGSIMGRLSGMIMAFISSALLVVMNAVNGGQGNLNLSYSVFESHFLLIFIMFIVGWFVGGLTDVETNYRRDLIHVANTDMLTGLNNHRYFHEKLNEICACTGNYYPISLILLDIDYFKHYNDNFGHLEGDRVLGAIGAIIKEIVAPPGFAARYGGGSFVITLPRCDSTEALIMAERLSKRITQEEFPGGEFQPEGKITVSCGVASYPQHAGSRKELLQKVDQALYRAKSLKKGKVEMYFSVFDTLELDESEKELINSIRTLVSIINAKDRYTYGHSERVTDHALKVAMSMGVSEEDLHLLSYASFLHDIGKIEIDRQILNKSGPLNDQEWEILKSHPRWGSDIIKAVRKLQPAAGVILYHHENYDGSGYPTGIKGEQIPLLSRIIRVVDSYDAMTSNRPYRNNLSHQEAILELQANAGTMFDPEVVWHLIQVLAREVQGPDGMIK